MNFIERIIGTFSNPDKTMEDIIKEPRIEESLVIVVAYAILAMIATYITLSHINYVVTDASLDSNALKMIALVFGVGGVLIMTLLAWPIVTAILHLFSMMFGGEGKIYPSMMTAIGYSQLPKLIAAVILIGMATQAPMSTVEVSSTGGYTMPNAVTGTLYWAQLAASWIFLLWSCYIGALAVKHGEKLSMKNALITVGIPLAIYVLLTFGMGYLTGLI
ncbi:MAG TPA: Yip1 family protein [Methanocella sp.]